MEGVKESDREFQEQDVEEGDAANEVTVTEEEEKTEKLKFIPPLEAELRMRLLYKEEHAIINLIWYPQLTEAGYISNPSGHSSFHFSHDFSPSASTVSARSGYCHFVDFFEHPAPKAAPDTDTAANKTANVFLLFISVFLLTLFNFQPFKEPTYTP